MPPNPLFGGEDGETIELNLLLFELKSPRRPPRGGIGSVKYYYGLKKKSGFLSTWNFMAICVYCSGRCYI